jgi:hypothetical protein
MIYLPAGRDQSCPQIPAKDFTGMMEAAMYELLGALAFAAVVTGYVLAIIFVRHEDDSLRGPISGDEDERLRNSEGLKRRTTQAG